MIMTDPKCVISFHNTKGLRISIHKNVYYMMYEHTITFSFSPNYV